MKMFKESNIILRTILKAIIPFTFLLGFYVLINGHLSPGGGFSGGTILAAGLIMHNLAYGKEKTNIFFNFNTFKYLSVISLSIYGLLKGISFTVGASGGSLDIPLGTPGSIFSGGYIPVLNIAVGLVVMSTLYYLYVFFEEGEA